MQIPVCRNPLSRGYRSAKNAVLDTMCQLTTTIMTDIEAVAFCTISDDTVIILTPDEECVRDTMSGLFAPGKYNADIPITFFVDECEFDAFYSVRDKIEAVIADLLTKMSTLLGGRYFRENGYNEILLNTSISFCVNVIVTDGVMYDRIHYAFEGVR